jgi:hypothetical protein
MFDISDVFKDNYFIKKGQVKLTDSTSYYKNDTIYLKKNKDLKVMRDDFFKIYKEEFVLPSQRKDFDNELANIGITVL